MDTPVVDTPVETTPVATAPSDPSDPFVLDETKLASLSPEQRAALDPIFDEWKGKAKSEIEKTGKTYEEKYKPQVEKAQALEELVKDSRFQQWWKGLQTAASAQNPGAAGEIQKTKPQEFATQAEWQQALVDWYNGDPTKFQEIQARAMSVMATPVIQQLKQGQEELKATLEMNDLFKNHEDARSLDAIGRDPSNPNDKSISLLEMCLNWADENGKSMEDGYQMAKRWADSLRVGAKQEAMGMVQAKKESVTSGPSTTKPAQAVVEVGSAEELMEKNMEYLASGQKPPRFVIRKQEAPSGARWVQKT